MDFLFLWQNPKRDYESNESVRDGLIRIRILRIHDVCVSLGKYSKIVHVVSGLNTKTKGSLTSFSSYFWTREIVE